MKKTRIFIVIAVTVIIAFLWWHGRQTAEGTNQASALNSPSAAPAFFDKTNSAASPINTTQSATDSSRTSPDAVKEYVAKITADPQYDWKQPINFYGRVVDESNVPVMGATASFEWTDLSEKGTSKANTTSDSDGQFSMTSQHGKRLVVDVGKDGYYSDGDARNASFEYANPADGLFTPDQNKPVVFHLRKKGVGVNLITSKYGMRTDFPVHIPRDGTPLMIDFLERQAGDNGQMKITENKPGFASWKQATNWWFRMEISDGGFVEENDEFPFTAPDDSYTNVVEFDFQKDHADWILNLTKDYYIKFGNPPKYGLLHIQTGISYDGATLKYAINPDGSRNLEPK